MYVEMQIQVAAEQPHLVNLAIDRLFKPEERSNLHHVVEQARRAVEQLQKMHPGWQRVISRLTAKQGESANKVDPDGQQLAPVDAKAAGPSTTTSPPVGQAQVWLNI